MTTTPTPSETPKPAINTNVRLFDLVRYMRSELHQADLITDEEYGYLCLSPMAVSPKGRSPSRERLEDYDELRAKLADLTKRLETAEEDSRLLDGLEAMANEPGGILLHDGSETGRRGLGLRPGRVNRTLRAAISAALTTKEKP